MIAEKQSIIQYFLPKVTYWLAGAVIGVLVGINLVIQPEQTLILAALVAIFAAVYKKQQLGLHIIVFLPVIGELIRLPIGPSSGVLVSDIFIPLFLAGWIAKEIFTAIPNAASKNTPHKRSKLFLPFTIFIAIGALSLLQSLTFLEISEVRTGSLYLIRFLQYGLLYFALLHTLQTEKQAKALLKSITISTLLLAIAGFIQLGVYPDLAELEEQGYDPHINRLVSTWLDPNFIGGLLAFIISILLGVALFAKKNAQKFGLFLIIAILGAALFLTYSRSAYLALAAGIFIISLLQSRKILIIALILFFVGITVSQRAQERVGELAQSATSIVISTADTPDPTAKLRIQSWEQTWSLIQKRPLLGSGYNTLRDVNLQEGFVKDEDVHSASGSDSSLLTVLATTGILGLAPFLFFYIIPLKTAFQNWRNKKIPRFWRGYSIGILGGIMALLVHSIFVNSLLFPQILIYFWVCIGILEWTTVNVCTASSSNTKTHHRSKSS